MNANINATEEGIEIDEFIENIFQMQPGAPHSVQLQVLADDDTESIFKFLVEVFTKGMILLYGDSNDKVNLDKVTDADFYLVKQYFNSFGVEIFLERTNLQTNETNGIMPDKQNDLNNRVINLVSNNIRFTVAFDYLRVH